MTADASGKVYDVKIDDHAKGIKIEFKGIDGKWIVIADHKTLPLGKKLLTLTSRQMVMKGIYYGKPGAPRQSKTAIKHEIKKTNSEVHIKPNGAASKPVVTAGAEPTSSTKETRVESGTPAQVAATVFTESNLFLSPQNEKYRKLILASAKRFGFTPHALAALIDAEAAKSKGAWNANSFNEGTDAAGLTQFLRGTWLEMVAEPRSLMNQRLKHEQKLDKIVGGRGSDGNYGLYSVNGEGKEAVKKKLGDKITNDILAWRFNPEYAIDTAALYGKINLEKLTKRGLNIAALAPEDLAKVMYLAHHEGPGGAVAVIRGTMNDDVAKNNLDSQIGEKAANAFIARFEKESEPAKTAYTYWLYHTLIDTKINVTHFMVKANGVSPKKMADIAVALGSAATMKPAAKEETQKAPTVPAQAGAAEGWHDPLKSCALRTAKLASVKGATFGMVRNGGKKPHQGIDLKADPGITIYAVANGKIVAINNNDIPGKGYGKTLTLEVDIKDLPKKQRDLVLAKKSDAKAVYFFYAHLTEISITKKNVSEGKLFAKGAALGTTGETGNANGMSTISKGAHLHFEVRLKVVAGLGLGNRLDPLPFINRYN